MNIRQIRLQNNVSRNIGILHNKRVNSSRRENNLNVHAHNKRAFKYMQEN